MQICSFAMILVYYTKSFKVYSHLLCQFCFPNLFFMNSKLHSSLMDSQLFFSMPEFFFKFHMLKARDWYHALPTQTFLVIQVQLLSYCEDFCLYRSHCSLGKVSWYTSVTSTLNISLFQHCVYQSILLPVSCYTVNTLQVERPYVELYSLIHIRAEFNNEEQR